MNDEEYFKRTYIATFLASYAAVSYDRNCQAGWPSESQPTEDADILAEQAWSQLNGK